MSNFSTILIHSNQLLSKGLQKVLSNTVFKPVSCEDSYHKIPVKFLRNDRDLLFIIGGENHAKLIETVSRVRRQHESAYVVVLSKYDTANAVLLALEAGARGYLLETISCEALLKALELVVLNETVMPLQFINELRSATESLSKVRATAIPNHSGAATASLVTGLSQQENAIIRCIAHGSPNKVIARHLRITEATVKVHVKAILRKIGVKNRTQAAVWAVVNRISVLQDPAPAVDQPRRSAANSCTRVLDEGRLQHSDEETLHT